MQGVGLAWVLLTVFVGEALGGCSGITKTYPAGDFHFWSKATGKPMRCQNSEPISVLTECKGACESAANYNFTSGQRPLPSGECTACKFTIEEVAITLNCTTRQSKNQFVSSTVTKQIRLPTGCGCHSCKKQKRQRRKKEKKDLVNISYEPSTQDGSNSVKPAPIVNGMILWPLRYRPGMQLGSLYWTPKTGNYTSPHMRKMMKMKKKSQKKGKRKGLRG